MSNLTKAQIETFVTFAKNVKEWLDSVTKGNASFRIFNDRKDFGKIWDALNNSNEKDEAKQGRLSFLLPVMNNTQNLAEHGVTKTRHQLRYPEFKEDGTTPHPLAGEKKFDDAGNEIWSKNHCVMYTAEAWRKLRTEITGMKSPETVYAITWDNAPADLQKLLSNKFPRKSEEYPEFAPKSLGFVLRNGAKPEKGQKRHAWAGIEFIIGGKYGDEQVVLTSVYVMYRPGTVARLAATLDIPCPEWNKPEQQEEAAEEKPVAVAASGMAAMKSALEDCGF